MSLEDPRNFNLQDKDSRQSLGQKLFLGQDGRVRPAIRAASFGIAALFTSTLASGLSAQLTSRFPFQWQLAASSTFVLCGVLLVSWVFVRAGDGAEWESLGLNFSPGWARRVALGAGIGFVLQAGIALALVLTQAQHYDARTAWDANTWANLAADVWLFVAAAASEELLFRGYALQRLRDAAGAPAAIVITSIAFGAAHVWNPAASVFSTLNTVLAGILLALAYFQRREMWMQCSLHAAWNFFMGPVFCVPVSGIVFGPQLFVTHTVGPAWWSGGSYGPEGGVVGSVALVAGIGWLLAMRARPSSQSEPPGVEYRQVL
jgi:membrane protease YdiL (CAAX protease family)